MNKFIVISIGGWAGWWVGAHVGMATAFILSMIGSGIAMYLYNVNQAK